MFSRLKLRPLKFHFKMEVIYLVMSKYVFFLRVMSINLVFIKAQSKAYIHVLEKY